MIDDSRYKRGALEYECLNEELLTRFPQLLPSYREVQELWDGHEPGPHIVYGDVLVPYIIGTLEDESERSIVESVFAFLEELLNGGRSSVRDVVGATVLEGLHGHESARLRARSYMGPLTRRLAQQIEEAWG